MGGDPGPPRRTRRTPVPPRIMFIEDLSDGPGITAHIGRVSFSRTARTARYHGRVFRRLQGQGFKANYYEAATGRHFRLADPSQAEAAGRRRVVVDEDCREEYEAMLRARHVTR